MNHWLKRFSCGLDCKETTSQIKEWFNYINEGNCYHEIIFDQYEYVCIHCGVVDPIPYYVIDPDARFIYWPRKYERIQYFDSLFDIILGHDHIELPNSYLDQLFSEMKCPCDWYEVYHQYKEWDLAPWWTSFFVMTWNKDKITFNHTHKNLMLFIDEHWEGSERNKKKINVFYMLFKIVELTQCDNDWVPMKLRSIAITRLDEEWKKICDSFNWTFIPTSKSLKKINWKRF